ncbi:MAG TPA: glycoside hydrolase 100 family protein [Streptosporangiales bacterium]
MSTDELLATARCRAEATVLANGGPYGLKGGARAYQQVWTREAVIAGLGLAVSSDPEGRAIVRRSLETVGSRQSPLGRIPHNVGEAGIPDPALHHDGGSMRGPTVDGLVVDTAHAGCVDNNLWYVLGHYVMAELEDAAEPVRADWDRLLRAYRWLEFQDSNECGLLEVHEAMDWADLFANRYNSLLPNVLWHAVNRAMASLARRLGEDGDGYENRAADIRFKLNQLLWVGPEVPREEAWIRANRMEWRYPTQLVDVVLQERPYYLPYMAFRDYGDRFDTLGNLFAILFGVAGEAQTDRILDYVVAAGVDQPWPLKACWPVVHPGEKDWREYYVLRNLNQPYQYHNGGCWPYIGAFYVAVLVKTGRLERARAELERLAEMNRTARFGGEWEFNEWFHGVSGRPAGFPGQSWSAGVFAFAHEAVTRGEVPVFHGGNGW